MRMVCEQGWFLVDIRADRRSYLEEWSGSSLLRHFRSRYHAVPELGEVNQPASAHSIGLLDQTTGLEKVGLLLEAGFNCLLCLLRWHVSHVVTYFSVVSVMISSSRIGGRAQGSIERGSHRAQSDTLGDDTYRSDDGRDDRS